MKARDISWNVSSWWPMCAEIPPWWKKGYFWLHQKPLTSYFHYLTKSTVMHDFFRCHIAIFWFVSVDRYSVLWSDMVKQAAIIHVRNVSTFSAIVDALIFIQSISRIVQLNLLKVQYLKMLFFICQVPDLPMFWPHHRGFLFLRYSCLELHNLGNIILFHFI